MSQDLAVVVVAYESAAELPATLDAVRAQLRHGDEVLVVDNGSQDDSAAVAEAHGARVVRSTNTGFAGGCHAGADATTAPLLLFLNPDAVPAPDCLDRLRAAADEHPDWLCWQALVTLPDGATVNTSGGVVHFLGFGWAGGHGTPASAVGADDAAVGFASGAALVVRRNAWQRSGGFDRRYFMYGEDLDLSLRLRLAGGGVGVVPAARVAHLYDFGKGDYKWFWLERNRWWTLLGAYPARLLALLLPALLLFELVLLAAAARGGWLRAKLRAQGAVLRELRPILARRRAVQDGAAVDARAFADGLVASLDSPFLAGAAAVPGVALLQRVYWRLVRALL